MAPQRIRETGGRQIKTCSNCKLTKPLEDFYSQKRTSKRKGNYIYYISQCKICMIKRSSKWQQDNHEHYLRQKHIYNTYQTKHNPEWQIRERTHAKEQRENGYQRAWQLKNAEKLKEYRENRRYNKEHFIRDSEWEDCKLYFNCRCAFCGLKIEGHYITRRGKIMWSDFHKDHLYHDGKNDLSNCIPLCNSCNSQKHQFTINQYYNPQNPNYKYERYYKIYLWIRYDYKKYISPK